MSFITSPGVIAPPLTAGGVAYGTGSQAKVNSAGTAGQVLTSAGASVPIWAAAVGPATPSAEGILYGKTNNLTPFQTFLGYQAGNVTTGLRSTFLGYQAGLLTTTGLDNTAVGAAALDANTTAERSTAIGSNALTSATTANNNTAVGTSALSNATTGGDNTAMGEGSLQQVTTGIENTAIGKAAGAGVSTGQKNTTLGGRAGINLETGSNNIVIGYDSTASSSSVSNQITLGSSSITSLRCAVTTITAISDARDKTNIVDLDAGLNLINAVRPVAFNWNMRDGGKVGKYDTGFIAQELQTAQATAGVNIPGLVFDDNPEKLEAGYGKLLPVMVKAIQELSAKVDALQAEITQLKGA